MWVKDSGLNLLSDLLCSRSAKIRSTRPGCPKESRFHGTSRGCDASKSAARWLPRPLSPSVERTSPPQGSQTYAKPRLHHTGWQGAAPPRCPVRFRPLGYAGSSPAPPTRFNFFWLLPGLIKAQGCPAPRAELTGFSLHWLPGLRPVAELAGRRTSRPYQIVGVFGVAVQREVRVTPVNFPSRNTSRCSHTTATSPTCDPGP